MLIERKSDLYKVKKLLGIFPVVAILGARQCGKTTLARQFSYNYYFDLENPRDLPPQPDIGKSQHSPRSFESSPAAATPHCQQVDCVEVFGYFRAIAFCFRFYGLLLYVKIVYNRKWIDDKYGYLMQEMKMAWFYQFLQRFRDAFLVRLNHEAPNYEQRIHNNFDNLYKHIHKGDIVLVEGRSQVSRIIKLFSQSHWSHIAIYIGDELVKPYRSDREKFLQAHGEQAKHLVIEAHSGEGVIASPLDKYCDYNIRICRPFGIHKKDLQAVIENVIGNLGRKYDQQNIIDIALMLLPQWLNPFKKRSMKACLGNCNDFQVICSGMIARAFQSVGYPIVPALGAFENGKKALHKNPYGAKLHMRHFSQILPRDFDLSPNFEVIKFNIIKNGKFRYKELPWEEGELVSNDTIANASDM